MQPYVYIVYIYKYLPPIFRAHLDSQKFEDNFWVLEKVHVGCQSGNPDSIFQPESVCTIMWLTYKCICKYIQIYTV